MLLYQGKAEVVKNTKRIVRSVTQSFNIPKIIRLVKHVTKIYKNKVPYSKTNIFIRDKFTCQYCGLVMKKDECTLDHVIPKYNGGESSWENCVTSCKRCNSRKGKKSLSEIGYKLKNPPKRPSIADFMRLKSSMLIGEDFFNNLD